MTEDAENLKVVKLKEVEPPKADEQVTEILKMIGDINDRGEVRSLLAVTFCKDNTILKSFQFGEKESRAGIVGSIELLKKFFMDQTDYLVEEIE